MVDSSQLTKQRISGLMLQTGLPFFLSPVVNGLIKMITIENWLSFPPNYICGHSFSLPTLGPFYRSELWGWKRTSHKPTDHKSTTRKKKFSTTVCQVKEASLDGLAMYIVWFWKSGLGRRRTGKCLLGAEGWGERNIKATEQLEVLGLFFILKVVRVYVY